MKKPLKNLLISIGSGYHPTVRLLHSMVKDKSDSKILIFNIVKPLSINERLREDYSVKYNEFKKTFGLLKDWLVKNQFELVGISFMSHHWDIFVEITKTIRQFLPNCKIIAGGVHAWLISPLETLEHCDYVCAAEGEELYSKLVDILTLSKDVYPLHIPGLIEKNGRGIIHTPVEKYMPINNLPIPTIGSKQIYSLFSLGDNLTFANEDPINNYSYCCVHIGRGCPFRCTFCINSLVENCRTSIRSVENVIDEIKAFLDINDFRAIMFMDEIFPLKDDWLKEFAFKYKNDIGLPFVITLYPGMLTYEKAKLLKYAGLKEVSIGIQTGSERIRKNVYNRPGRNHKIIEENTILSNLNIMTYYDFIMRNPFELEQDYKMSLNLVRNLKRPFYLKFHTLAFYPKHPITKMALDSGLIDPKEVDTTIGYFDVTTPHKVAIAKHYLVENRLVIWHSKLKKEALNGSVEALYYLLISYHGFWFIPKFVLNFLHLQFIKKRMWILHTFTWLIQAVLLTRNNFFIKKAYLTISLYKDKGLLYAINKIRKKIICPYNVNQMLSKIDKKENLTEDHACIK